MSFVIPPNTKKILFAESKNEDEVKKTKSSLLRVIQFK